MHVRIVKSERSVIFLNSQLKYVS